MSSLAVVFDPTSELPALIARAGKPAAQRFLEFFTVNIRNPVHVAAYVEELGCELAPPSVKQHLACLRMLFDWLVTGQVLPSNLAHSVRGPRHSVMEGSTAVISSEEARELLDSMDASNLVRLRDRAIIAVMAYTFARSARS